MIIGGYPIGGAPLGAGPGWQTAIPSLVLSGGGDVSLVFINPYLGLFRETRAQVVHALSLSAWALPDGPETIIRRSDLGFITSGADEPASTPFDPAIVQPLEWQQSMVRGSAPGGFVEGSGEIVLPNTDGQYDGLETTSTLRGRAVDLRMGRLGEAHDAMAPVMRGTVFDYHADDTELRLQVRDRSAVFDVPVGLYTFAGTGEFEGGSDLAGKRQPVVLGTVTNIAPTLVWPQKLIYMVDSLSFVMGSLGGPEVNGAAVGYGGLYSTFADISDDDLKPAAGQYKLGIDNDGRWWIRLGSPLANEVLAYSRWSKLSLFGAPFSGGLASKARCIYELVKLLDLLDDAEIDVAAFVAHHNAHPASVGLFFDANDTSTVRQAIDRFCGENTFCGFRRDGRLTIGLVDAPTGAAALTLDDTEILSLEKERGSDGITPPPWRWRVGWGRNWTDMQGRIAGSVDATYRAFLEQPIRWASAEDAAIKTAYPLAQERDSLDDLYDSQGAAAAEAARLIGLWRGGFRFWRMTVGRVGLAAEIGDMIIVRSARHGLADPKAMLVVASSFNLETATVEIVGFG